MRRLRIKLTVLFYCLSWGLIAQDSLKIKQLAESFLKQTRLPGLSIAVAKADKVIYAKGFGFSNLENQLPMLSSNRIRTASVAKVLTATALGRLVSEGLLDFDAPIKNYVPYIKKDYENLTVRQLAGHTSGLKHRPSASGYQNKQYHTIKETVEIINGPLLFQPGTDYRYSTAAFNLLAAVIEGASQMSYDQYMKFKIFEPLGMQYTSPENINKLTEKDAEIYYLKKNRLKKDKLNNGSYKVPGAAFRSTPSDLVKLMEAYSVRGFVTAEVVADMFSSNSLPNGEKTNVGIAWRSSIDAFGNNVIEHAGSWRGARTVLVYYPKEELSISLMINAESQLLIEETAHIFAQLFLNNKVENSWMNLDRRIQVVHNSTKGEVFYEGHIFLGSGKGFLTVESENFLKSNEVIQLPNGFALSTFYGLFFVEIDTSSTLNGKVYAYRTMNKISPKEERPLLKFIGLE